MSFFGHFELMVSPRNICRAAEMAALEQGATLALEGLHFKRATAQVLGHVATGPYKATFARAVERNSEGQDADEGCASAHPHGVCSHSLGDGGGDEGTLRRCRGVIPKKNRGRHAEGGVPIHTKSSRYDGEGEGADEA